MPLALRSLRGSAQLYAESMSADKGLFVCSTYDRRWQEAMAELNEQVHIEDHTLVENGQDSSTAEAVRCQSLSMKMTGTS